MVSASDVAALAFHLADRIMELLLCFLGGPAPRNPAVDQAAVFLLLVLPTACVAGVFVAHFAEVALAYLRPHADGSSADLWRFAFIFFTLVFVWLLAIAVVLALFYFFLGAGKPGTGPGFGGSSVLS